MNVFTDFHHASLLQSFILLFERRLGGKVYRPIGMDWAEKGFWKVYDHPATQQQYLAIGGATPDGTPPLNDIDGHATYPRPEGGFDSEPYVYFCRDIDSGKFNNAITFDGFMRTSFDIVIASLPQHIEPFKRLCELHPSKPKLIYQIGNQWEVVDTNLVKNFMISAKVDPSFQNFHDINYVQYHQEFELSTFFYQPINDDNMPLQNIYSFVNVFQGFPDFPLFEAIEKEMPNWTFASYGGQCRDGSANGTLELSTRMREAKFIWHTKAGGDGYGHVIHNAAAVGRPLITKKSYYAGKLGEDLMIDDTTCINIDNLSHSEIIEKITYFSETERYKRMCQAVYDNFQSVCNFDEEEQDIRLFLDKLL